MRFVYRHYHLISPYSGSARGGVEHLSHFFGQHVAVTFTRRNASRATIMTEPSKDSAADQVKVQVDEANRCFALKKYDGAADLLASALEEL